MTYANNAAYDKQHTSLHMLLQAVEVAHEKEAQRETSDADRLVAHDHALVQCRREPRTSLLTQLLKAGKFVHETEETAPGRRSTWHGTSDSHGIVAQDHMLVQCRREQSEFPDLLNMRDSFELAEGAEEPGTSVESAPVFSSKKQSRHAARGLPFVDSHCFLG
ncbi:hypothetical protein T484DRAFT_1914445 [Baffinella frigidus]|nr:hypothetical protein T484DRAFT_1914445 [Cryptophyta sp. CCMP2293]